jgi:hypothetical protein
MASTAITVPMMRLRLLAWGVGGGGLVRADLGEVVGSMLILVVFARVLFVQDGPAKPSMAPSTDMFRNVHCARPSCYKAGTVFTPIYTVASTMAAVNAKRARNTVRARLSIRSQ